MDSRRETMPGTCAGSSMSGVEVRRELMTRRGELSAALEELGAMVACDGGCAIAKEMF